MRVLLDTCSLIWLAQEPDRLSPRCRGVVDDPETALFVSYASAWEMALKSLAGKLVFPIPLRRWGAEQRSRWQFEWLPITLDHILRTTEIEKIHVDPFDRLLVAQALADDLAIATPDSVIARYPIQILW